MGTIREALGFNLKLLRKERGLSQEEWAEFLEIPKRTYIRYELGEAFPQEAHLEQILKKLKVEEDALVQLPVARALKASEPQVSFGATERRDPQGSIEVSRTATLIGEIMLELVDFDKTQLPGILEIIQSAKRGGLVQQPDLARKAD